MLVCFRLQLSDLLCQIPQIGLHPLVILLDLWLIHIGELDILPWIRFTYLDLRAAELLSLISR